MLKKRKLKKAEYIKRNYDEKIDCCCSKCDYAHDAYSKDCDADSYRMCKRLNIRVGKYDYCKYYSEEKYMQLLMQYVFSDTDIDKP